GPGVGGCVGLVAGLPGVFLRCVAGVYSAIGSEIFCLSSLCCWLPLPGFLARLWVCSVLFGVVSPVVLFCCGGFCLSFWFLQLWVWKFTAGVWVLQLVVWMFAVAEGFCFQALPISFAHLLISLALPCWTNALLVVAVFMQLIGSGC
ncbi:hypothetical protein U1Q18_037890, partial [Sarracenia purpurea var. burkii]